MLHSVSERRHARARGVDGELLTEKQACSLTFVNCITSKISTYKPVGARKQTRQVVKSNHQVKTTKSSDQVTKTFLQSKNLPQAKNPCKVQYVAHQI